MLKPLKIVVMLFITVVGLSVAVYFVEDVTSQVIAERKAEEMRQIIASLSDIFPAMEDTYQVTEAESTPAAEAVGITTTLLITDASNNPKGYVYFVTFRGFASDIEYMISVDSTGFIGGFEVLSQADTPDYGGRISNPENWEQFANMSFQVAGNGDFDGITGASITTGAWKNSVALLYEYHADTYGITELTEEQLLQIKLETLAGGTLVDYTNTNPFADYGITDVQITEDGSTVVYTAEFVGFAATDHNTYAVAFDTTTNEALGYVTIYSGDTVDYGAARMYDTTLWSQLAGISSVDMQSIELDGFAGTSITGSSFEASLVKVSLYHRWEFEGDKIYTRDELYEMAIENFYPASASAEDVSSVKQPSAVINKVLDVYNSSQSYLGVVYNVITFVTIDDEIYYMELMVGINENNQFTGLWIIDTDIDDELVEGYLVNTYDDTLFGDLITDPITLTQLASSSEVYNKLLVVLNAVVDYQIHQYPIPNPIAIDNESHLVAAYPGATTFVSVYADYSANARILNIYEAQDDLGTVLGYVYYAKSTGKEDLIYYTFGVSVTGLTQQLHIVSDSETWDQAVHDNYKTSSTWGTDFTTTIWLDQFEGIQIDTLVDTDITTIAGVSLTTGGMIDSIEAIAAYHIDQAVGGAE